MASPSIFERKRDLVYLIYFVIHLPIMLAFDLTHLYPSFLQFPWMSALQRWYVGMYGDRFFYDAPVWFPIYSAMELLYHIPLALYAIPALLRNSPYLPLHLLVYAVQVSITTLTCLAEMMGWEELEEWQRGWGGLGGMYGAYLGIGVFMAVDMGMRLHRIISKAMAVEGAREGGKKEL